MLVVEGPKPGLSGPLYGSVENLFKRPVTADGTVHELDKEVEAGVDVPDDDVE